MTVEPNDPTRAGSPLPVQGSGRVALSRNEIEALCMKAARATGMSWGLAEEAGFAAGWLCAHGLDGAAELLIHLEACQNKPWDTVCPIVGKGHWHPSGTAPMCPIATGAALCDFAGLPDGLWKETQLAVGPVASPMLILPFLADIAWRHRLEIMISVKTGASSLSPGSPVAEAATTLRGVKVSTLIISHRTGNAGRSTGTGASMTAIDRSTFAGLNGFAMKTTVPASEQSRSGAGAGLSDND